MTDTTLDRTADAVVQASVETVGGVPAHAVQEMTKRMAGLVTDSAARYFNGDIKAALAAQAVVLKQMAGDPVSQDAFSVLAAEFLASSCLSEDQTQG
jgi:hypothetical protein